VFIFSTARHSLEPLDRLRLAVTAGRLRPAGEMLRPEGPPFAQPLPKRQLAEVEGKAAALPARSRCTHRLRDVSGQDLGARALRALHRADGPLPCRWVAALVFRRTAVGG